MTLAPVTDASQPLRALAPASVAESSFQPRMQVMDAIRALATRNGERVVIGDS